ncbi:MAG: flagellar hook-associated protein FlgL [Proteobacteria bacterium]|nr:flagellar hook-associated protein FlgL [Pseudomonadota bacterium]MBU1137598.1 flagellar hook-associated protein FlgL [Pseudomonadota bacterium]MBU1233577.1 flagellar hook-associated protein FlgL [Pseudomonadota bacterium]MBU1420578.1 flagellar hook-associated protein FlgL [Pseudomonadota bacterium]MBU1454989.1 flagellar hook-associated protein FlgL [Pseudomonadota bacterium]
MIITRDASAYNVLQYNLANNSNTLNELYIKSSTGVEVAKASDNPSLVRSILSGRSDIMKGEQYIENCQHIQDSLSTAETYIDSVEALMTRAKEIAISGANDGLSPADQNTLAEEVEQLQEALLDLANAEVDGKYIFAGYNDQVLPFSRDPVVYNGTDDHKMIEISPGSTVAKNITGEELFMDPVDLFAVLDNLATALQGGDSSVIATQLTPLEDAAEQVRTQQSLLGNTSARMDDIKAMHESAVLLLQETLSRNEDADLAAVLSEVAKMETSLEATMQVTARVSSLQLMDYL